MSLVQEAEMLRVRVQPMRASTARESMRQRMQSWGGEKNLSMSPLSPRPADRKGRCALPRPSLPAVCASSLPRCPPQPPFVFYNKEAEGDEDLFSGLTIDVARLLEKELNCQFRFIVSNPEQPEVRPACASVGACWHRCICAYAYEDASIDA